MVGGPGDDDVATGGSLAVACISRSVLDLLQWPGDKVHRGECGDTTRGNLSKQ